MKVPVLDQSVDPRAATTYQPDLVRPSTAIADAISQGTDALAQGGTQLAAGISKEAKRARDEAGALSEAEANLALDTRASDSLAQFKTLQGTQASEARAQTYQALDQDRQKVAEGIQDPDAKRRFLIASAQRLQGYHREIDAHVGREFEVARDTVVKARVAQGLAMAESGDVGGDFQTLTAQIEQDVSANAPPEARAALVDRVRSDLAFARVRGLVAQGQANEAAKALDENPTLFGHNYDDARKLVAHGVAADTVRLRDASVQKLVGGWSDEARDENGFVDQGKLRTKAEAIPRDYPSRALVDLQLDRVARVEKEKLDAAVKEHDDNALRTALVDWKPIDPADAQFLRRYAPQKLVALEAERRAIIRQFQARASGAGGTRAAAKAQADIDKEAFNTYRAALVDDPSTQPEDFLRDYVAAKAAEGDDVTVTPVMRSQMLLAQKTAAQRAATTEGRADSAVAKELSMTFATLDAKKGKKNDPHDVAVRVGTAMDEYDRRVAANGGKPLDAEAVSKFKAEMTQQALTAPTGSFLGISYGQKKVRGVDLLPKDAGPLTVPGKPAKAPAPDKRAALLQWAKDNPTNPKAQALLKKLGAQ